MAVLSGLVPLQIREYRPSIGFSLCAFMVICSLLLGGGTHGGFLSDAILELLAIPVLILSLSSLIELPLWKAKDRPDVPRLLVFCLAVALVPLLQLVPLPPAIWTRLPGREYAVSVLGLLGTATPWMPISLSPHSTWLSFLSLLPPMATFLVTVQLGYRDRRGISLVIIAMGVISAFVGLIQVAQGQSSPLRFFAITNPTEAVGFFANRNHFAALLYAILLFTAAWAIEAGFKTESWTDLRTFSGVKTIGITASFLILIVVIAGEAMARSRAGLALTIFAVLVIYALAYLDPRNGSGAGPGKLMFVAVSLAVVFLLQFALYRILNRFGSDPLQGARIVFARNTIEAAWAFMPFGSGSGTFVPIYQIFEKPADLIASTYVNHAHDDFLEIWLETGIVGAMLLGFFMFWLASSMLKLWRRPPANMSALDCTLARAASAVIILFMAHSVVDYPMRTDAIMTMFAVCCAFLVAPLRGGAIEAGFTVRAAGRNRGARKETAAAAITAAAAESRWAGPAAPEPAKEVFPPAVPRTGARWGENVDWPAEWQTSGSHRGAASGSPRPGAIVDANGARAETGAVTDQSDDPGAESKGETSDS